MRKLQYNSKNYIGVVRKIAEWHANLFQLFSTAMYFPCGVLYRYIQEHPIAIIHKTEGGVADFVAISLNFLFALHQPAGGQRSAACSEPDSTGGVATTGKAEVLN